MGWLARGKHSRRSIFLDIEGAFDNIPFDAIKHALDNSVGKGNIRNWTPTMQLQVSTRQLQFTVKNAAFIIYNVLAGCPQGGVLSRFL